MDSNSFVQMLRDTKEWFDRSTGCLVENDSTFAPFDGAMTTAQVVAHVAQTVDWFMEGASRLEGATVPSQGSLERITTDRLVEATTGEFQVLERVPMLRALMR